jgi:thiol-disulfide isomerase/thioredoxin
MVRLLNLRERAWPTWPQFVSLLALALACVTPNTHADAWRGKTLYASVPPSGGAPSCSNAACHKADPTTNTNKIRNGANNAALITSAINGNTGGMGTLRNKWTATDITDIALYIANPGVTAPPPPPVGVAVAQLGPGTLTYASTVINQTATPQTITLSNTGTAALSITSMSLIGTNPGEFTLTPNAGCTAGSTLAAGTGSCTLTLGFAPQVVGSKSATVSIVHSVGTSTVNLLGTAAAVPLATMTLDQNLLDFGQQTVFTQSAVVKTVTVGNSGTANLVLNNISTSTGATNSFLLGGTCAANVAILPNTTCTVDVRFNPAAIGALSSNLTLSSNASNGSPLSVTLQGSGTAVPAAVISVSPGTLSFGNQTLNVASGTQLITVQNTGNAAATLSAPTLNAGAFSMLNPTACGTSIAANTACSLQIQFRPTATGNQSATFQITSNASPTPYQVQLSGSGVTLPTPTPTLSQSQLFTFPATTVGTPQSTLATLTAGNTGSAAYRITTLRLIGANPGDFALGGTCAVNTSITSTAGCTVTVKFSPTSVGTRNARFEMVTDSNTTLGFDVTGQATAVAVTSAQLSLTSLQLTAQVGSSTYGRTRITNTGNQTVTVSSVAVGAPFSVITDGTTCPAAPFTSAAMPCDIEVQFNPTIAGNSASTLTVVSASPGPTLTAGITGTATAIPVVVIPPSTPGTTTPPPTTPTVTTPVDPLATPTTTGTNMTTSPTTTTPSTTSNATTANAATTAGDQVTPTSPFNAGAGGCTASENGNDISMFLLLLGAGITALRRKALPLLRVTATSAAVLALSVSVNDANALDVGAKAPDFNLAGQKDNVKLADLKGQYVYVDFWASWCGPCKQSFPWMNAMHDKYGSKGLKVIGVNLDAKKDDAAKFLAEVPAQFTVAFDGTGATPKAYGVKGMPTSVLIGPDGNVLFTHSGFKDSEKAELETKIRTAMEKK